MLMRIFTGCKFSTKIRDIQEAGNVSKEKENVRNMCHKYRRTWMGSFCQIIVKVSIKCRIMELEGNPKATNTLILENFAVCVVLLLGICPQHVWKEDRDASINS